MPDLTARLSLVGHEVGSNSLRGVRSHFLKRDPSGPRRLNRLVLLSSDMGDSEVGPQGNPERVGEKHGDDINARACVFTGV